MKSTSSFIRSISNKVFVMFGSLFVLLPVSPLNSHSIDRDPGVFLYVGWRILNGELPYRDVWDHKPPLIFYINALGQFFVRESRWGVWALELLSLFFASYIGFRIIKGALGRSSAIFSLFYWLLTLVFVIRWGNLTEEFALPLQFACLWVVYKSDQKKFSFWHNFGLGILIALSFFIKQTTIGIGCAIILYLLIDRISHRRFFQLLKEIFVIFIGFLFITTIIFMFFAFQGILGDFWKAAFEYNFVYVNTNYFSNLKLSALGLLLLMINGFLLFSLIGYAFALRIVINKKPIDENWKAILKIALINLPLEYLLVSTSGRAYDHYYISMLPTLSIFSGLAFSEIYELIKEKTRGKIPIRLFAIIMIFIFSLGTSGSYKAHIEKIMMVSEDKKIVQMIMNSTSESDSILMWGAESDINFETRRASPSKFVYQYPLYMNGFTDKQLIENFLTEIIQNRPALIIDTKNVEAPFLSFTIKTENIDNSVNYLKTHYNIKSQINGWDVYEYVDYP